MRECVIQVLRNSEWENLTDIRNSDIITCIINGEMLEGIVYVSSKDITVMLYNTDIHLKVSSHIMPEAPKTYTIDHFNDSRLNSYGILRMKELFAGLYHDYNIISKTRSNIIALLPDFLSIKKEHNASIMQLNKRKAVLKKELKAGNTSPKKYMREMDLIKEALHEEQFRLKKQFYKIYDHMLAECVNCDNLMEAIESLATDQQ